MGCPLFYGKIISVCGCREQRTTGTEIWGLHGAVELVELIKLLKQNKNTRGRGDFSGSSFIPGPHHRIFAPARVVQNCPRPFCRLAL